MVTESKCSSHLLSNQVKIISGQQTTKSLVIDLDIHQLIDDSSLNNYVKFSNDKMIFSSDYSIYTLIIRYIKSLGKKPRLELGNSVSPSSYFKFLLQSQSFFIRSKTTLVQCTASFESLSAQLQEEIANSSKKEDYSWSTTWPEKTG